MKTGFFGSKLSYKKVKLLSVICTCSVYSEAKTKVLARETTTTTKHLAVEKKGSQ